MGRYRSDDSDSEYSRKSKKKKKRRGRSRSSSDSEGSHMSSSRSKKARKKHRTRSSRSRSRSADRRRGADSRASRRSRSPSYSSRKSYSSSRKSRSPPPRWRSRSKSPSSRRRRSRSYSRGRRSRSGSTSRSHRRSRSHSRGRRSHSADRAQSQRSSVERRSDTSRSGVAMTSGVVRGSSKLDQGTAVNEKSQAAQAEERMRLALKAAAAADEKLKSQGQAGGDPHSSTINSSVTDSKLFAESVAAIESNSFVQSSFKSSRSAKVKEEPQESGPSHDDAIFGSLAVSGFTIAPDPDTRPLQLDPDSIMHPSLYCDPEEKMDRWIQRLTQLRRRKLEGEAMLT